MQKALIGILVLLSCACGYGFITASRLRSELEAIQTLNRELQTAVRASERLREADAKAVRQAQAEVLAIKKRKEAQSASLSKAKTDAPDWAASAVPRSVLDALGM